MDITLWFASPQISVFEYRCSASSTDKPFTEYHEQHSLSLVRRGSFGLRSRGTRQELVAGATMIGCTGDEYCCVHNHHDCGDQCISLKLSPAFVSETALRASVWRLGAVPPLCALMLLGEQIHVAATGRIGLAVDELAHVFANRFARLISCYTPSAPGVGAQDERRAVRAAMWIAANAGQNITLDSAAAQANLSPYHFLRMFQRVLGVSPHQYLLRCRLQEAARLLNDGCSVTDAAYRAGFADLSNFSRTFHRAAGVTPGVFRRCS